MSVNLQLTDQIALVTGASRGIGFAVAKKLAEAGATIIGIARSGDGLARLKAEIESRGGQCHVHCLDVSDRSSLETFLKNIAKTFGPSQILVHNAGIYETAAVQNMPDEVWLNT